MERILNLENGLDVALLDEIMTKLNHGSKQERPQAEKLLVALQDHQDSWTAVDKILESSNVIETKYFALQILEKAIKFRWKVLPEPQREGIKNYLVNLIIRLAQDPAFVQHPDPNTRRMHKLYLNKLDLTLVALVKQEWPHKWQNFIPEIVNASKTSELLCENNMHILMLLSEEVFEFSSGNMTHAKIKELKDAYNSQFSLIFELCDYVLKATNSESLVSTTLQTLLRFLSWIPLGYIFQTSMVETIVQRYYIYPQFRVDALKCLVEIGSLDIGGMYQTNFVQMYAITLDTLKRVHIPPQVNIKDMWENGSEADEQFIQTVALFLTGFFRAHLRLLEQQANRELLDGMDYLVAISRIGDWELLKICVDFWHFFAMDMYQSENGPEAAGLGGRSTRVLLYSRILSDVRRVMIENMAKPEEVLVVENEDGEVVREAMKDSDMITMYKTMREALIYLTHLDYNDTESIMLDKLCHQVDGSEWSFNNLNTLCWAVGSISGAIQEEKEKQFLVSVIKDLLSLCEIKRGKDNKAIVASNIMYVVGQYPRFLRAHWKFLKTVANKLFEFMHEKHPGVQDMACDTFLKIAKKCRLNFVTLQANEQMPFVDHLLQPSAHVPTTPIINPQPPFTLPQVIAVLERHQVHTVYEAVGTMIASLGDHDAQRRDMLVAQLMDLPNKEWAMIIQNAHARPDSLSDLDTANRVVNVLRTNTKACSALGPAFRRQLSEMYQTMLYVYKADSEMISTAIQRDGAVAAHHVNVRALRTSKRETMRLIETFVKQCDDVAFITQNLVPPLVEFVLADYNVCVPDARNPEVLLLFATIINRAEEAMVSEVPRVLGAVFECTLQMITRNFEDYPEHRTFFFQLLRAIVEHCFPALFQLSEQQFKLVVDSICWALKHTDRVNSELGLTILQVFLQRVQANPQIAGVCFQRFYVTLLQEVFYVLTDTFHKSGFKQQSAILMHMVSLVANNEIQVPIFDPAQHPNLQTNKDFLHHHLVSLLGSSFPNVANSHVVAFCEGLFVNCKDSAAFKVHLRDFLVELKEFSSDDNKELYADEAQARALEQQRLAVPGLVPGAHDGMAD